MYSIVTLDAALQSTMQWQEPRKKALAAIAEGKKILWHLDLGLFDRLTSPLSNTAQFMTLRLALDHFRDSIWDEFQRYSVGAALYKGSPDFSLEFVWDSEQKENYKSWLVESSQEENEIQKKLFCRDVCSAYITQLAENIPDRIPVFLIFNNNSDPLLHLLLTSPDLYPRCKLLMDENNPQDPNASLAICWPSTEKKSTKDFEELAAASTRLQQSGIPYRIISESNLTIEWQGLDHIIFQPQSLSPAGIRKLRGFQAAGGTLVTVGDFFGFSQEISFESFLSESV